MRLKLTAILIACLMVVSFAPVAHAQESDGGVINSTLEPVGRAFVFIIDVVMYVASVPAAIFDNTGNALDGFSDDTAEIDAPVPRGLDTIPDEAQALPGPATGDVAVGT